MGTPLSMSTMDTSTRHGRTTFLATRSKSGCLWLLLTHIENGRTDRFFWYGKLNTNLGVKR